MTKKNKFASTIKGNTPKSTSNTVPVAVKKPTESDVAIVDRPSEASQTWKEPRTRKGRKAITSYVTTDAHKQLKLLAIEQDKTIKELMDEAVASLLREYGKTPLN